LGPCPSNAKITKGKTMLNDERITELVAELIADVKAGAATPSGSSGMAHRYSPTTGATHWWTPTRRR